MLLLISSLSANASDLALSLATVSIVICPVLCGLMAYRVSRTYANLRSGGCDQLVAERNYSQGVSS